VGFGEYVEAVLLELLLTELLLAVVLLALELLVSAISITTDNKPIISKHIPNTLTNFFRDLCEPLSDNFFPQRGQYVGEPGNCTRQRGQNFP
jgi:hypothetical protein